MTAVASRRVNSVGHAYFVPLVCFVASKDYNERSIRERLMFLDYPVDMKLYQVLRDAAKFRSVFDFGGRDVAQWFPGHMAKGDCAEIPSQSVRW